MVRRRSGDSVRWTFTASHCKMPHSVQSTVTKLLKNSENLGSSCSTTCVHGGDGASTLLLAVLRNFSVKAFGPKRTDDFGPRRPAAFTVLEQATHRRSHRLMVAQQQFRSRVFQILYRRSSTLFWSTFVGFTVELCVQEAILKQHTFDNQQAKVNEKF